MLVLWLLLFCVVVVSVLYCIFVLPIMALLLSWLFDATVAIAAAVAVVCDVGAVDGADVVAVVLCCVVVDIVVVDVCAFVGVAIIVLVIAVFICCPCC